MAKKLSKLGQILAETGLTTKQIANLLHTSVSTVYNWKQGRLLPSLKKDILIKNKLHINIGKFDVKASNKIKKLLMARGVKRLKYLRLSKKLSLQQVSKSTGLAVRQIVDAEQGRKISFISIYTLAKFYHTQVRIITKRKFSLYQIYTTINSRNVKLRILRKLSRYTLIYLHNHLSTQPSIEYLSQVEDNPKFISMQLVSNLSQLYKLPLNILLTFLNCEIKRPKTKIARKQSGALTKSFRLQKKVTLAEIHNHTGINRTVLSSFENGHGNFSINKLPILAHFYHISLDMLLNVMKFKVVTATKQLNSEALTKYLF